ncbi:MAG: peptidase T [Marinilabiliales bacterium]|nr:peptidase T [Marinilabiliales bacterium]
MEKEVVERFLRYVVQDTRSNPDSNESPSSDGQKRFGNHLAEELVRLGLSDITVDWNGYVMATLPSNMEVDLPVVGFVAHMDTSPECSGSNVRPRIVTDYQGEDIVLHPANQRTLSPQRFPELLKYKGQSLIVTDGTTLLGADDKAGVAEIVTAMEYLQQHPEIKHGKVRIAFTPDEEISRGADHFYVPAFGASFAYTVDGGEIGELQYENFNAASAHIVFHGANVHPGSAKNKMRNSLLMATSYVQALPSLEVPEHTEGYQGFFHLVKMEGRVDHTKLEFIIRDFDRTRFEGRKQLLQTGIDAINRQFGEGTAEIHLLDQYYNMKEKILPVMHIVDIAKKAMTACGIEPIVVPVRGGTDGSRLSYMGLPCPNLFTGGHNFHGEYEFIPVQSMAAACHVIVSIIREVATFTT